MGNGRWRSRLPTAHHSTREGAFRSKLAQLSRNRPHSREANSGSRKTAALCDQSVIAALVPTSRNDSAMQTFASALETRITNALRRSCRQCSRQPSDEALNVRWRQLVFGIHRPIGSFDLPGIRTEFVQIVKSYEHNRAEEECQQNNHRCLHDFANEGHGTDLPVRSRNFNISRIGSRLGDRLTTLGHTFQVERNCFLHFPFDFLVRPAGCDAPV